MADSTLDTAKDTTTEISVLAADSQTGSAPDTTDESANEKEPKKLGLLSRVLAKMEKVNARIEADSLKPNSSQTSPSLGSAPTTTGDSERIPGELGLLSRVAAKLEGINARNDNEEEDIALDAEEEDVLAQVIDQLDSSSDPDSSSDTDSSSDPDSSSAWIEGANVQIGPEVLRNEDSGTGPTPAVDTAFTAVPKDKVEGARRTASDLDSKLAKVALGTAAVALASLLGNEIRKHIEKRQRQKERKDGIAQGPTSKGKDANVEEATTGAVPATAAAAALVRNEIRKHIEERDARQREAKQKEREDGTAPGLTTQGKGANDEKGITALDADARGDRNKTMESKIEGNGGVQEAVTNPGADLEAGDEKKVTVAAQEMTPERSGLSRRAWASIKRIVKQEVAVRRLQTQEQTAEESPAETTPIEQDERRQKEKADIVDVVIEKFQEEQRIDAAEVRELTAQLKEIIDKKRTSH
ncbi:hypothetical protein A4X09_0g1827 [Tilletia walkeri]|uniref:Uncharacterized protein n=1 Tax=Tilletia walkeri TaxID=117179 RepID=A0A8X7NAX1_9BASI|nr:hypothetical protein A4X09_0g1827 [Tilletia walkeri]